MTLRATIQRIAQHEDLNFLLTNRLPRTLVTRFMGWFSGIEQPLIRDLSLGIWKLFAELELEDAAHSDWKSLHDCFIRELRPGARPIDQDPAILVSPCDAIVGASGRIRDGQLFQAKGLPYTLDELLHDQGLCARYRDGHYVTLRLTSSMYHRFHAPHDLRMRQVTYVSGDTWNTNPVAVSRIDKLFCKNERAILDATLTATGTPITLVPVASILIASIRLHCLDVLLHLRYPGPHEIPCDAQLRKGQEMGWFQHGSTILVFAPAPMTLCEAVQPGHVIRMGQPLLRLNTHQTTPSS